jgi:hypothetical protein
MEPLEYAGYQHSLQQTAIEICRKKLQEAIDERQMAAGLPTEYDIDSHVLVDYPSPVIPVGAPIKLRTHKKGPYIILSREGPIYRVRHVGTLVESDVHISRITPFLFDRDRVDPEAVAFRDSDSYKVEKIVAFRRTGPKKDWTIKVHWLGYPDTEDSWISWKEAQKLEVMHAYLHEQGLETLIPKSYLKDSQPKKRTRIH